MVGQLATGGRPRRVDFRVPVDILCSKGIRLSGKTRNVSEGGMFVETSLLLPVGSPVRCGLALQQSSVEVFGRIAWSRPRQNWATAGMGIQFVGFEDGARRLLHDVVESGEPVPQMISPEVTARIPRPSRRRYLLAAVFAGVAAVSSAIVTAVLPSRDTPSGNPVVDQVASGAVPAAMTAPSPVAEAESADEADREAAEPGDQVPVATSAVAIVPRRDGTTAVTIPLQGDFEIRHYRLADPDGVALFVDGGSTSAELTTYRHAEGTVQAVWVGAEGREIRIFTRGAPPAYRVDRFERTLRVLFESGATAVSR